MLAVQYSAILPRTRTFWSGSFKTNDYSRVDLDRKYAQLKAQAYKQAKNALGEGCVMLSVYLVEEDISLR
jgi:hypothetical protein